jgi:diguanylate cyclase (GGDEF)-like protein
MCQNYLTYTYFIKAGIKNKELDVTLKERNQKLEVLSTTLEQQVSQRTNELAKANQKLEVLVNEDPLTCLLNRRGLMQHINQAKQDFEVFQTPFCLVLIDFDHFKKLNDELGHDVGDNVLETGGIIMKEMVKDKGYAGRWGGEEFLVLLTNRTLDQGKKVAEDIREQVYFDLTSQIKHSVTITLGITECKTGDSIDTCLKRTDLALYEGKKLGRNRVISA